MLPRPLRLLWDTSPPGGVVLSSFRSRDPEEGGGPGGQGVGGGQEQEEEEEEEEDEALVSVWDEEEEGATFTVTSRQYRPLDPLAPTPPPRSSRRLRAGTLEALVRHLLDARTSGADMTFTAAFLATHRAFTSTPALLQLVIDRLEALESHSDELERTKGVAISVLSTWLASHPEDFGSEVKGQLDRLESFLLRTGYAAGSGVGGGNADLIRNLRSRVDPQAPDLPKPLALPGDPPADPTDVLVFLADHLAEQLTLLDAELFLSLVPSQCLGSLWGHRDRPGHSHLCPSVRATVTQFNKVAGAVVSSVLGATSTGDGPGEVTIRPLRPPQRARLLEKWIRVAEECRLLRNFSSVYAVVSALQSSPIHRLRAAWGEAARDSLRVFSSLCQIFSEEDNYSQSRELLLQEVKLQPSVEANSKKTPTRPSSRRGGVVPYLGTFLKDLVMLDAASKDELENGYINFDKRRKEFAVLSELRRLQNECRGYDLRPDPDIQQWLRGLRSLTEAQSHCVSCDVEPPGSSDTPPSRVLRPALVISQCTEVLGSVGGPTPLVSWDRPSIGGDEVPGNPAPLLSRLAQHMKWPSVSSLDSALESTPSLHSPVDSSHLSPPASSPRPSRGHRRSASCGSPLSGSAEVNSRGAAYGAGGSGPGSSDCRIIRVQMELGEDGSVYKSILVTSQDKAPSVISRVLKKNNRDSAVTSEYELVQLLPGDRELTIPPSANVFYAMDGISHDFLLRQRRKTSTATPGLASNPSASGTPPSEGGGGSFPRIKATGRKIARALF